MYLSPELVGGAAPSVASDCWALGCTLYHALCGRPPVWADSQAEVMKDRQVRRPGRWEVPRGLRRRRARAGDGADDARRRRAPRRRRRERRARPRLLRRPRRRLAVLADAAAAQGRDRGAGAARGVEPAAELDDVEPAAPATSLAEEGGGLERSRRRASRRTRRSRRRSRRCGAAAAAGRGGGTPFGAGEHREVDEESLEPMEA